MADNPKLEIEIVLADGTVTKAFGRIVKEAETSGDKSGKAFSVGFADALERQANGALGPLGSIVSLSRGAALALGGVAAAATAAGAALFAAFEGDKLLKIEKQFNNIATSFGVVGPELSNSIQAALNSTVDTEDAIKAATNSLVQLNGNASKTAELFKIAQQASNQFGGDAIENFQTLSRAIATGNSRVLAGIGLQVDLDKAQKQYKTTIGALNRELTDSEKIQSNLNTILATASQRYAGISAETLGLSGAFAALKVSAGDVFESVAIAINQTIGPALTALFNTTSNALKALASFVSGAGISGSSFITAVLPNALQILISQYNLLSGATDKAAKSLKDLNSEQFQQVLNANRNAAILKETELLEKQRLTNEAIAKELPKLAALENQIQSQRIANLQALTAATDDEYQKQFNTIQLASFQVLQIELAANAQRAEAQRLFNLGVISSELEFTELLKQIAQNRADQISQIQEQSNLETRRAAEREKQTLAAQNAFIAQSTANAISATIAAFARAIAAGGNVFKAFGKSFLGVIGNLAVTLGQFVIGAAIAFSALKKSIAGSPFLAIAAGAALITLGSILQNAANSGDSGTGQSVTALSGPGIGGPALVTDDVSPEVQNLRPNDAQTQITVNVEGSILTDNDELGLRIVQVINDAFDRQGLTIRQGAVV